MGETNRKLSDVQCFLMDMDGTIYLGDRLLPGAREWLALLDEKGISYLFLTNNSSRSKVEYAQKLQRLGLPVPEEKIFTSGEGDCDLPRQGIPGGEPAGLWDARSAAGI